MTQNNTTITTTAANSFIVDAIGWNTTKPLATTTITLSGDANNSTLTEDFSYEINLSTGGVLGGGSGTAVTAGNYNLGWNITQNDTNTGRSALNEMAFAFTPVPEPSTALLSGLGLLALLRRKRA